MLSIIILGPIASSLLCVTFGKLIGSNVHKVVLLTYVVSSLTSLALLYTVAVNGSTLILSLSNWATTLGTGFEFSIDLINGSLLCVVVIIGTCVMSYTSYYMAHEAKLNTFVALLSGFVTFMIVLAISNNLVVLFIGWELIGLYSYLLIGFWNDRVEASNAALSAMLTNKLGDYLLSFGLVLVFAQVSTFDIGLTDALYSYYNSTGSNSTSNALIGILALSFLIASMAKSAQIGLHLWLIHAMQGPTPVSSLLHAATLVVAGPILLFKVSSIVQYQFGLIVLIGIITSLLGALLAIIQSDIKAVIAYSTMSQFGYIISIAALSSQAVANLHITTHAAFKCCLFMAAGIVIHSLSDIQDNRSYGGLIKLLPIGYIATLLCTISLIALPYTSGSISKDLILEVHAAQYSLSNNTAFIIGSIVAAITALYSTKLLIITYISTSNTSRSTYEKLHGANAYAYIPLIVLSTLAIVLGYMAMPLLIDGHGYLDSLVIAELYNTDVKVIPVLFVLLGIALAIT